MSGQSERRCAEEAGQHVKQERQRAEEERRNRQEAESPAHIKGE
jgi:hypothetical protein